MNPRLQLLHPRNLIGYSLTLLPSESARQVTDHGNLIGYSGAAATYRESEGNAGGEAFGAEIHHLLNEMTLGGDCA